MSIFKAEAFLRLCSIILLVLTACLVGFDSQNKELFEGYSRKATFKDVDALYLLVFIDSGAAVYNLFQFIVKLVCSGQEADPKITYAWFCLLLDQMWWADSPQTSVSLQVTVYVVFGVTSAALSASLLAVTGSKSFQWMKLCDRYTRFCTQIGGALLCSFIAILLMAIVSSLSAFNVFRNYSPKQLLVLKAK